MMGDGFKINGNELLFVIVDRYLRAKRNGIIRPFFLVWKN